MLHGLTAGMYVLPKNWNLDEQSYCEIGDTAVMIIGHFTGYTGASRCPGAFNVETIMDSGLRPNDGDVPV